MTYSGLWNSVYNETYALTGRDSLRKHLMLILKKPGFDVFDEILQTLITDSTPASTALVSRPQVAGDDLVGSPIANGGVRTIETRTKINRAITAADKTDMLRILRDSTTERVFAPTYPTDLSGNGGGGKLGV